MPILPPIISSSSILPKIVYPSSPGFPAPPSLSSVSGAALAAVTYYVRLTYSTVYGESLPSEESALAVAADKLLVIAAPAQPAISFLATGWNTYVSTASSAETRQNTQPIAFGTNWGELSTGLVANTPAPTSWGSSFVFVYPPRKLPASKAHVIGQFNMSGSGLQQSLVQYVDYRLSFEMPAIALGPDADNWVAFLGQAVQGVPFDFYPDSTQPGFTTYLMIDRDFSLEYAAPGIYSAKLNWREVIV